MASAATRPTEWQAGSLPHHQNTFHNTFTEVKMTEIQAQAGASDASRLAEENQRLTAENQRLKTEQQARQAAAFLAELRTGGQLTPAMEQAGLAQALTVAAAQPTQVSLPDGRNVPLCDVLREVLRTLPTLCPQAGSALAGSGAGGYGYATPGAPLREPRYSLSPTEREVAAKLGLTDQEYAEIKSAG
jgi:hypothetical protein